MRESSEAFYAHVNCLNPPSIANKTAMSDEGPSEKKIKMADRIVVDSPLAPPAIGLYFCTFLSPTVARSITNIFSLLATLMGVTWTHF
jgi:hypothetical protein